MCSVVSAYVTPRLVLLASGTGTTISAILDSDLRSQVVALGTDVANCGAVARARQAGVPTFSHTVAEYPSRDDWNLALADTIASYRPDFVICAGFMRLLGPAVVARFRLVNTHPSLLPSFPGAHAIRDALAHGVKVSGVTVHVVDEGLDTGPILAQVAVPVCVGDTEQSLQERIQAAEKPLLVDTIRLLDKEKTS